jgi:hypothetical protein
LRGVGFTQWLSKPCEDRECKTCLKTMSWWQFTTPTEAEGGIKELQRSGFDIMKLSIVGEEYHTEEHVIGYYNTGDRMKYWGEMGAFRGGMW